MPTTYPGLWSPGLYILENSHLSPTPFSQCPFPRTLSPTSEDRAQEDTFLFVMFQKIPHRSQHLRALGLRAACAGGGGRVVHQETVCHLAWTTRQDRCCPGRCSPEITDTTFRRHCHRSGKGAWTTAEQLRFLLLPPRRGRRSQVWGTQVRPELLPECLTVRLRRKRRLAPAAFRGRRSSAAAASGVERGDPRVVWRRKGDSRGLLAAGAGCRRRR